MKLTTHLPLVPKLGRMIPTIVFTLGWGYNLRMRRRKQLSVGCWFYTLKDLNYGLLAYKVNVKGKAAMCICILTGGKTPRILNLGTR